MFMGRAKAWRGQKDVIKALIDNQTKQEDKIFRSASNPGWAYPNRRGQ